MRWKPNGGDSSPAVVSIVSSSEAEIMSRNWPIWAASRRSTGGRFSTVVVSSYVSDAALRTRSIRTPIPNRSTLLLAPEDSTWSRSCLTLSSSSRDLSSGDPTSGAVCDCIAVAMISHRSCDTLSCTSPELSLSSFAIRRGIRSQPYSQLTILCSSSFSSHATILRRRSTMAGLLMCTRKRSMAFSLRRRISTVCPLFLARR
mmetsp:Transcript_55066/g.76353  ORF Transcript_55066/g.76353 Transcript_55066/m.76353 type:complete len:202 (+) Transcript_55066:52-657(+)